MKIITWTIRILVLIALVWLAILNNQSVTFSLLEGMQFQLPLIVLLFAFFVAGILMGVLMLLPKNISLRWEARKLRKEGEKNQALLSEQQKKLASIENKSEQDAPMRDVNTDLPPFTM